MKKILFLVFLFAAFSVTAQKKQYKIVFDLVSKDTADYSAVLRQFNNILKEAPDAQVEVVCHGPALAMLVKGQTAVEEKMNELKQKGNVYFKACANTMKRMNVDKSQLVSVAEVVPVAMLELADKEMEGWSYIRGGH